MNEEIASFDTALDDLEEIISIGLWHWTVGTQELAWSKQLYKIFGLDRASFKPSLDSALALIYPEDRKGTNTKLLGAVADKEPTEHEFRIIRADGEVRVCWAKVRPIIEDGVVVAVRGTCLDVTYLRETEALARENEENYRHIIELSPQTPWTADRSGSVLSMGATWTSITGLPVQEALGSGWLSYVHPDDLGVAHAMIEQAHAENPAVDFRYRLRRLDGTYRWVRTRAYPRRDEQGEVIRWYGLTEDIHEQMEAEQRLRESEEHYRYTVELSPQIPWTADECGNIIEIGPRWLELVGMEREAARGQGWAAALHPDDVAPILANWNNCLASGEPLDARYRLKLVSGRYNWFRARARPRRDEKNQIIRWYGIAEDIDEQVRAEDALKRAEERYRLATRATNDLIWDFDPLNKRLEWTHSLVDGFGYPAEELGTNIRWWSNRIHPEDSAGTLSAFHQALRSGDQQFVCEYRFRRADESYANVYGRGYIVRDENGRATRVVGAMQDLTERKLAEEKAHWGATHDALTELPNRRFFHERLQQALAFAEAHNSKVGLLHLDVDHFKQVNDAMGHGAGDALLRNLASRLREAVRSGDTIARLGGDEFAIILPGVGNTEDAATVAQALLGRMREPLNYDGRSLDCRVSIGASVYPEHGSSPEELLKSADIALYAAKEAKRGSFLMFEDNMRTEMRKRSSMIALARSAICDDRLVPYYQPQVEIQQQNRVLGYEALLRWRDPGGRVQLPMTIKAAFEDLELAAEISDCMIEKTIGDMCRWLDDGVNFGHVAVNAAAAEFTHDNFGERVLEALAKAQVPTKHFQLEVTETVFLGHGAEYVGRALKLLSSEGVRIALDDFGTGYASLRHLKEFPVDIIKIDRSFVQGMATSSEDKAIVRAVVNLGESLGISIVAEGIETGAQHQEASEMGCGFGQGFLYSQAVPSSLVPELVARSERPGWCFQEGPMGLGKLA